MIRFPSWVDTYLFCYGILRRCKEAYIAVVGNRGDTLNKMELESSPAPDSLSPEESKPFQYRPLESKRHIRLLRLHAASVNSEPLRASLEHFDIDNLVPPNSESQEDTPHGKQRVLYYALSYTWGTEKGDRPIICDGQKLNITKNCESALRTLRQATSMVIGNSIPALLVPLRSGNCWFWVDAICIDQSTEAETGERPNQVAMMYDIYSKAAFTMAWIGKASGATSKTLELVDRIGAHLLKCPVYNISPTDGSTFYQFHIWRANNLAHSLLKFNDQEKQAGRAEPLLALFKSSWQNRGWTLQEAAASAERCLLFFGPEPGHNTVIQACQNTRFLTSAEFLSERYDNFNPPDHRDLNTDLEQQITQLRRMLDRCMTARLTPWINQTPSLQLGEDDPAYNLMQEILKTLRKVQVGKARDKLYSLYSILKAFGLDIPAPDYTKPVIHIFEEIAKLIICNTGQLNILSYTCLKDREPGLPSWVPDWTASGHYLSDISLQNFSRFGEGSRNCSMPIEFSRQGQIIVCGKQLGTVAERSKRDLARDAQGRIMRTAEQQEFLAITIRKILDSIIGFEVPEGLSECEPFGENKSESSNESMTPWTRLAEEIHCLLTFREWAQLVLQQNELDGTQQDKWTRFHATLTRNFSRMGGLNEKVKPEAIEVWHSTLYFPQIPYREQEVISAASVFEQMNRLRGIIENAVPASCQDRQDTLDCLTNFVAFFFQLEGIASGGFPFTYQSNEVLEVNQLLYRSIWDEAFVILASGLFGTANHNVRVGDVICQLKGVKEPWVLRPEGDCFQVVGSAYIPGLSLQDEDSLALQDWEKLALV